MGVDLMDSHHSLMHTHGNTLHTIALAYTCVSSGVFTLLTKKLDSKSNHFYFRNLLCSMLDLTKHNHWTPSHSGPQRTVSDSQRTFSNHGASHRRTLSADLTTEPSTIAHSEVTIYNICSSLFTVSFLRILYESFTLSFFEQLIHSYFIEVIVYRNNVSHTISKSAARALIAFCVGKCCSSLTHVVLAVCLTYTCAVCLVKVTSQER